MKKLILLVLTLGILIGMLTITVRKAIETSHQMPAITVPDITNLPDFQFEDLDGNPFSNLDLKKGKSTIIIHYIPSCGFCNEEAKYISHFHSEFEKSQVLFVSNQNKKSIEAFKHKHSLESYQNIHFLQYKDHKFKKIFGVERNPSLFIFDTHFKLLKNINEGVNAKTLIKYTRAANDR